MKIEFTKIQNGWLVTIELSHHEKQTIDGSPMFFAHINDALEWVRKNFQKFD